MHREYHGDRSRGLQAHLESKVEFVSLPIRAQLGIQFEAGKTRARVQFAQRVRPSSSLRLEAREWTAFRRAFGRRALVTRNPDRQSDEQSNSTLDGRNRALR